MQIHGVVWMSKQLQYFSAALCTSLQLLRERSLWEPKEEAFLEVDHDQLSPKVLQHSQHPWPLEEQTSTLPHLPRNEVCTA